MTKIIQRTFIIFTVSQNSIYKSHVILYYKVVYNVLIQIKENLNIKCDVIINIEILQII